MGDFNGIFDVWDSFIALVLNSNVHILSTSHSATLLFLSMSKYLLSLDNSLDSKKD